MNTEDISNMRKSLSLLRKHVARLELDIVAFDKRAEEDATFPMLTAHGWCVVTDSLAILCEGEWLRPVPIEPHLCGFTCMGKANADAVASRRNSAWHHDGLSGLADPPWKAVRVEGLAARQAARLRELKEGLEEAIRETEASLADKGVEA